LSFLQSREGISSLDGTQQTALTRWPQNESLYNAITDSFRLCEERSLTGQMGKA
jgi:hypothetical protein